MLSRPTGNYSHLLTSGYEVSAIAEGHDNYFVNSCHQDMSDKAGRRVFQKTGHTRYQ